MSETVWSGCFCYGSCRCPACTPFWMRWWIRRSPHVCWHSRPTRGQVQRSATGRGVPEETPDA
jgi:hypothetical protein